MRRKIVVNGPSTLTISLPSKWVKENNLKKGNEIDLTVKDDGLLIHPIGGSTEIKERVISFDGLSENAWQSILYAIHRKGYDKVKIDYLKQDLSKKIHSFLTKEQLGYEIIEHDMDHAVINSILTPAKEQLGSLVRRMFRIAIEYTYKVARVMQEKEDATESCLSHEVSIGRISRHCKRIIISNGKKDNVFSYSAIEKLEAISRTLSLLLEDTKTSEPKRWDIQSCAKILISQGKLLEDIHHLKHKFSTEQYNSTKTLSEKMIKKLSSCKSETGESCHCEYMMMINKNINRLLDTVLVENI